MGRKFNGLIADTKIIVQNPPQPVTTISFPITTTCNYAASNITDVDDLNPSGGGTPTLVNNFQYIRGSQTLSSSNMYTSVIAAPVTHGANQQIDDWDKEESLQIAINHVELHNYKQANNVRFQKLGIQSVRLELKDANGSTVYTSEPITPSIPYDLNTGEQTDDPTTEITSFSVNPAFYLTISDIIKDYISQPTAVVFTSCNINIQLNPVYIYTYGWIIDYRDKEVYKVVRVPNSTNIRTGSDPGTTAKITDYNGNA
jgi:hypothetical protein